MASPAATLNKPQSLGHEDTRSGIIARPGYNVALGYLRGFLVVLVLAHHSVLAYIWAPPQIATLLAHRTSLLSQPRLWPAFPVWGDVHWAGFSLFVWFNDNFFMSLMFLVSGLFVWASLQRKGSASFIRDRARRLGIPFLFAAALVAPVAYYPAYLMTGAHGLGGYVREWLALGGWWPAGPAWFIWLLLAFDLATGAMFAAMPRFGDAIGRLASNGREHPVRFFWLLVGASAAAYIPMAGVFGPLNWTMFGPFEFQTARLFHYAVYFLAGIAVGANGSERGLLAPDGKLARRWARWTILMIATFLTFVALVAAGQGRTPSPAEAAIVGGAIFALACGTISFAFLALFVRFARRRFWVFDSLSDNEYGMYLIHYMFVSWVQFAILGLALPAIGKGLLVFATVLLLSWGTSAAIRGIPLVSRIV
ncbi:MAG: acyltransferase [Candidatus Binataceae bacterium]